MTAYELLVHSATELVDSRKGFDVHNTYAECNLNASLAMIKAGYGTAIYGTQWSSGTTCWNTQPDNMPVTVDTSGRILLNGKEQK